MPFGPGAEKPRCQIRFWKGGGGGEGRFHIKTRILPSQFEQKGHRGIAAKKKNIRDLLRFKIKELKWKKKFFFFLLWKGKEFEDVFFFFGNDYSLGEEFETDLVVALSLETYITF